MCTPSVESRKIFPLWEKKQKATYNAYFATPFLRNLTEITDLVRKKRLSRGVYNICVPLTAY